MHPVELLEQALEVARQQGYQIRHDWLGGDGSGHCMVKGRPWLLLDLAQSPEEQLAGIACALREESQKDQALLSPELADWIHASHTA